MDLVSLALLRSYRQNDTRKNPHLHKCIVHNNVSASIMSILVRRHLGFVYIVIVFASANKRRK